MYDSEACFFLFGDNCCEAIEIGINNKEQALKPGMYAEVKIPLLSSSSSLPVPNHAMVRSTEKQYVIQVVGGKAV